MIVRARTPKADSFPGGYLQFLAKPRGLRQFVIACDPRVRQEWTSLSRISSGQYMPRTKADLRRHLGLLARRFGRSCGRNGECEPKSLVAGHGQLWGGRHCRPNARVAVRRNRRPRKCSPVSPPRLISPTSPCYPQPSRPHIHAVQHRQQQIRHRRVLGVVDMPSRIQAAIALADDEDGQLVCGDCCRQCRRRRELASGRAGGVAVAGGLHFGDEFGEQAHVIGLNLGQLGEVGGSLR